MRLIEKAAVGFFMLILLYLVLNNLDRFNNLLQSGGTAWNRQLAALEGR